MTRLSPKTKGAQAWTKTEKEGPMKLKNRIFHIMTISLLILSAVLLSACGKQEAGSMKLTKTELSDKEKALADLLAPVGSSRLFDFTVDETKMCIRDSP